MGILGFHGRLEELEWLRGMWEACAKRDASTGRFCGGPRMAVIIAESGIGKSRLVQALYQQLTNDPKWDPQEVNYWPEAFNDQGIQLRVTPDMKGHVPKGPPKFAWLGARWQAPDIRNVSDRRTVLLELRHAIITHAEILNSHGSAWDDAHHRIREALRKHSAGEAISQVADAAVPFGSVLMKIARGVTDFAKDRAAGPRSFEQAENESNMALIDDLCETLSSLLDGSGGLPTVIWLDDAQWIDDETKEFVRRIWHTATHRCWPLLLVVTHWEREWEQLKKSARTGLIAMEGKPGVEVRRLGDAPKDDLDAYLQEHLTGLTETQRGLLLTKAGGNFLSMVENVGYLLRVPISFVNRDVQSALTPAGEQVVHKWESERQKRVEQRFGELGEELRDLLGWSSHLGLRFLHEVVEDFAKEQKQQRAAELLSEAVSPLVILGRPHAHLREFRDRAFHHVAANYFRNYLQDHAERLNNILRGRLVEWVNNSFDDAGNEIWLDTDRHFTASERSATGLTDEERRDLLGMAVRELPLPSQPDWERLEDIAAFRAVYLLVVTDARENLWDRVRERIGLLKDWPFADMPFEVLSLDSLDRLVDTARTAGAFVIAGRIAEAALAARQQTLALETTPKSLSDLHSSLVRVADIETSLGKADAALTKYEESLGIARQLAEQLATPKSLRDVSVSLARMAAIEAARGDLDAARAKYKEGLRIARQLAEQRENPQSLRDLSVSLVRVAVIEATRGKWGAALVKLSRSLFVQSQLAEQMERRIILQLAKQLAKLQSLRDVSISLDSVSDIEASRGKWDAVLAKCEERLGIFRLLERRLGDTDSPCRFALRSALGFRNEMADIERELSQVGAALAKYEEGLQICRQLAERLGDPRSLREVSVSLKRVADIEASRGKWDALLAKYEESMGVFRQLAEQLGTRAGRRDVSVSLAGVADIQVARGDLAEALSKYEESLGTFRRLAEQVRTPESRRDVRLSVNDVADIQTSLGRVDAALAKYEESLQICRQFAEHLGLPECLRDVSVSLERVDYFEAARGKWDAVLTKYEESLRSARQLAERLGNPESLRDVSVSLINEGDIKASCGKWDAVLARYKVSMGFFRQLAEQLWDPGFLRDVSVNLERLADTYRSLEHPFTAKEAYKTSLRIFRLLAEQVGTLESLRDVRVSLSKVADLAASRGVWEAALAKYEEGLQICRQLAEQLGDPRSLRDVRVSLNKVADIERELGKWEAALAKYEEGLQICRQLAEQLGDPRSLRDVRVSLSKVADIEASRGKWDAALAKYEECLRIARQLAEHLGTVESLRDVRVSLYKVADIERELGEVDAALAKYEEGLQICRQFAERLGTIDSLRDMNVSLINVADMEASRGKWGAALAKYKESMGIFRQLAERLGTPDSLRDTSVCLTLVAGIEQSRGDLDAAQAKYQESLGIRRQLAGDSKTPQSLHDLIIGLNNMAGIAHARGDMDAALAKDQESLEVSRQLAEQLGTPESLRHVSVSLERVADFEAACGKVDAALTKYQESLEIASQLYAQRTAERDPEACNGVVWIAHLTAACLNAMDRSAEALKLLQVHADDAAKLEADCGGDVNQLDTCAAFWESYAAACSAIGDTGTASAHAARAAALRARIDALADEGDDSSPASPQ